MSEVPYKLSLTKGVNTSLIELNDSGNLNITDPNIGLIGAVNVNNNYILPQSSPVSGNSYLLNAGAGNQLSFSQYSPVSLSQFQYNLYVSTSGNDANNGSIASPYKTIGACMTFVNTLSADASVSINLASGIYNEAILITKSGVSIIGSSSIGCVVVGDIGINMVQNSSFYSIAEISDLQITGQISVLNSTAFSNSTVLSNLVVVPPPNFNCLSVNTTGGSILADITIKNSSVLYMTPNTSAINLINGSLTMIGSQIANTPLLNNNTTKSMIIVSGSSRCNLFGSSLLQASSQATCASLIDVGNTSNATSSSTINSCILLFLAGTLSNTASIINFSNTASANTYFFYNNAVRTNYNIGTGSDKYIISKSSTGAVNFTFGNVLSYNNTNHSIPNTGFQTGYVKTAMKTVS
jgi:hypothetical protein